MVGSWCFISSKLHVSKIKALFRLSGWSEKIRAFTEGSVHVKKSLEKKKVPSVYNRPNAATRFLNAYADHKHLV